MPSNGIIQGIRPLVGYNYGAKEYNRINKIYKLTLGLSLIIMIAGTLLCFVFPKESWDSLPRIKKHLMPV